MISLILGRSADSDVMLYDSSVSGTHARLALADDGKITVEDLKSANGTYVNGKPVRMALLSSDDILKLGNCLIPWKTLFERANGYHQSIQAARTITLGRDVSNNVPLDHPSVSRKHACLFQLTDGTVIFEDLGSSNGSRVNGQKINRCKLFRGESLMLGLLSVDWEALLNSPSVPGPSLLKKEEASREKTPSNILKDRTPYKNAGLLKGVLIGLAIVAIGALLYFFVIKPYFLMPDIDGQIPGSSGTASAEQINPAAYPGNDASLSDLVQYVEQCVFLIETSDKLGYNLSMGTGFFVSSVGVGVTNYHVMEGYSKFRVKTIKGEVFEISRIIKSNKKQDYAIFQVSNSTGRKFPSLPIAKEMPRKGDPVFVVGNPQGIESTLSKGVVSAIRGDYNKTTGKFNKGDALIQIDASISPGSSGSPVMNMKGEVIGIATMILSGENTQNLNFAVNIKILDLD